jgi:hypothetical protein
MRETVKIESNDPLDENKNEINVLDIINQAMDHNIKTKNIITLLQLMSYEIQVMKVPDHMVQLNYKEFFKVFVKKRKIKLLRYLFSQKIEFEFSAHIFILALEEDAYDLATLMHDEFSYLMRDNSVEEKKQIVNHIVSSLNKTTNQGAGMIDQKCYLIREYLDYFQLRNARTMLDFIDKKVNIANKLNILVSNFNVVKTGCLLIEVLELVALKFDQLKVRCVNIRLRIEDHVGIYLMRVIGESEIRYLLLEKDLEERDSLDLITKWSILRFLQSSFAENVVKEIWRSPYATSDQIQNASTNFYLLFKYYNCE